MGELLTTVTLNRSGVSVATAGTSVSVESNYSTVVKSQASINQFFVTFPALDSGIEDGDIIRWNDALDAWEVKSEPFEFKQIVLTPAVAALVDQEGSLWYKSTDKSIYVCADV